MKLLKFATPILAATIILGCSKGPSSSDIENVMNNNLNEFNKLMPKALGNNIKFELHEVKNHGCEEKQDGAFICDVEIDMTAPVVGRNKDRSKVEFVKRDGEWATVKAFRP